VPELPDIELYLHCLRPRVLGHALQRVKVISPFLVRTVDPPIFDLEGRVVEDLRRLGKRIVFAFADDLFMIVHLMIAGRLRWEEAPLIKAEAPSPRPSPAPGKGRGRQSRINHARFDFDRGTLLVTEAGTKKRASIHIVRGEAALRLHDPGGIDVLTAPLRAFASALRGDNHTLKRALTDPHTFSGIGNAYSDEILHRAQLSPIKLTQKLSDDEVARLHAATRSTLHEWTARLQEQFADRFPGPGDVTAFRPDFAAHGKFGQPCPRCSTPIQRIIYADNETNYCPRCQTGGKLLADRSLSRLLKDDWPKSVDALE
jgi:formamidopyrimidine-DNA glycosylase